MKKTLRTVCAVLLTPVVLLMLLAALLYVPDVQNWVVQRVAATMSAKTGMDVSVGHVALGFPLDLTVDDVTVARRGDTIAHVGRAVVSVRLLPLLRRQVVVGRMQMDDTRLNTLDLVDDMQVRGTVGRLSAEAQGIDMGAGTVHLGDAQLADADVTVVMADTAATDTTASAPLPWRIDIDNVDIARTRVEVHTAGDSLLAAAVLGTASAQRVGIDLERGRYAAGRLALDDGRLSLDRPFAAPTAGIDPGHLSLTDMGVTIDSVVVQWPQVELYVARATMHEQSGLHIDDLHGGVSLDERSLHTDRLTLKTPHSVVKAQAHIDLDVLDSIAPGQIDLRLDASIGRQDLMLLAADYIDKDQQRRWPDWPLAISGHVAGNMRQATVEDIELSLPTAFHARVNGTVANIGNDDLMTARLDVEAQTHDGGVVSALAMLPPSVRVPAGLSLSGHLTADGQRYGADLTARQGRGRATLRGHYDGRNDSYEARVTTDRLDIGAFMPHDSIGLLTASASVKGRGTDMLSPATHIDATVAVERIDIGSKTIDGIEAEASLHDGQAVATLSSANSLMDGSIEAHATLGKDKVSATVGARLGCIDLHAAGLSDRQLIIGMDGSFDVTSDMADAHRIEGTIENISVADMASTYHTPRVVMNLMTDSDTTSLSLSSGSLKVKADASGGYRPLIDGLSALADTLRSQYEHRIIDQDQLKSMLPTMSLYVSAAGDNPFAGILKSVADISFRNMLVDLNSSASTGLNGQAYVHGLNADSVRIDTVAVRLRDRGKGLTFNGQVTNNRRNPQFVFNALFDGLVQQRGASIGVRLYDSHGDMGLRLGAKAEMETDGVRLHLIPERPTIGYTEFSLNADNFLLLRNDLKLQANVDLAADDGTGIKVYSADQDSTLLQDLTISLNRIDLGRVTSALPYMPSMAGMLNGDYHLTMNADNNISVASDMQIGGLSYEGCTMGDMSTEFVYLQREDDTHAVEGIVMIDGREVGSMRGSYQNRGEGLLDATLTLTHTPLRLINGFIPDRLFGFEGYAEGEVAVKGSLKHPQAEGELYLDSAYLVSQPYGVRLRFDDDPVRIIDSQLLLENFTMYAYNQNPLNIMGNIDFHDTDHMTMNVRMRTQNFQLINSKQKSGSIAYGKMFVNFFAIMQGPVEQLSMRGKLDILGTTDLNYILLDSPLSTDNQMDELVKFTDFSDSTHVGIERPTPEGLTADLSVSIDQGAHVVCGLNADQTNYVDIFGGGDLRMRYSAGDLSLTGRYTLTSGEMKYSLPIIPLKTFTIQDGSYVEFTGDPMNPRLNLTATERTKASVGQDGGQSRSVTFDCGVVITRTLNDMGLEFIISAPEDMTISSELASMSTEQRGKLAVTMLTTGMYLADGNTSGFSMNSALSSFLQSEINTITGNALKTLDLSIGLDNTTDASGQMHTDYSFKFAKRFWNNRLKVQIGGKVSTGTEVQGQQQSFFDNVTMEYRLSPTANQYVKMFYNQNAYDWLEGYTGEYGGGFIWKRKLDSVWDIFTFWKRQPAMTMPARQPQREQTDSIKTNDETR